MLTGHQAEILDLILDEVIPPSADGHVPGAAAAGVASFFVRAAPYDPDPTAVALAIIAAAEHMAADFRDLAQAGRIRILQQIETAQPAIFTRFLRLTYMGYYSQPRLRPLFGVAAHPVHPRGYEVSPEDPALLDELTAPVRARGPIYRGNDAAEETRDDM